MQIISVCTKRFPQMHLIFCTAAELYYTFTNLKLIKQSNTFRFIHAILFSYTHKKGFTPAGCEIICESHFTNIDGPYCLQI